MRHVIIGNGPAGVVAAETIRKHRADDEIVLIGDEPSPPYSRMAIPYLVCGDIDAAGTHLRKEPGYFEGARIELRSGLVTAIDPAAKQLVLADGATLAYDRCLIATGSVPTEPPVPGIEHPVVQPCWTLADADRIMALATKGARVLQLGAGFIGCIIMEALARRGVQLTVVEMDERMVPRMMGAGAAALIRSWCEKQGVRVLTSTRLERLEPAKPVRAVFADGGGGEFDLVIRATGVRPHIGFLAGSGIACDAGVLVDSHLCSSAPDVYAAGDCAEAWDETLGQRVVSAIQPNAVDQGRIAGLNMAGLPTETREVTQINVLDTMGLVSSSFGRWDGVEGGDSVETSDGDKFRYLRLEFEGEFLIGANTVGWTDHIGVLRSLVEGHIALGQWKERLMRDPMRLMEAYLACAQAQERSPIPPNMGGARRAS